MRPMTLHNLLNARIVRAPSHHRGEMPVACASGASRWATLPTDVLCSDSSNTGMRGEHRRLETS